MMRWLLRLLGVDARTDYRRVQWPTREGRPPITLPRKMTHEQFAALRKASQEQK